MAVARTSDTLGSVERTVSCMVTPDVSSASLARTKASWPPRQIPARQSVCELFPSGTLSERSHGCRPRYWMMFLMASVTTQQKLVRIPDTIAILDSLCYNTAEVGQVSRYYYYSRWPLLQHSRSWLGFQILLLFQMASVTTQQKLARFPDTIAILDSLCYNTGVFDQVSKQYCYSSQPLLQKLVRFLNITIFDGFCYNRRNWLDFQVLVFMIASGLTTVVSFSNS